jgi:YjbE family integral membrane protein
MYMEIQLFSWEFFAALGSIIILDLVLAGDNAVVIAMAANTLPQELRRKAIFIGTFGAVAIRFLMTLVAVWLLTIPCLQALGGLVLLPIAVKLLAPSGDHGTESVKTGSGLMSAIRTIIIADAAMGIDNVLAIAGAAQGHYVLVGLGLLISIPIVVFGSQLIGKILDRFPALLYAGAAILGWTSGTMLLHDAIVGNAIIAATDPVMTYVLPAVLAIIVCAIGYRKSKTVKKG